jgi:hypothetical protein
MNDGSKVDSERDYEHVIDIKTKNQIVSFAISCDGKYVACSQISTKSSLTIWRFNWKLTEHLELDSQSISLTPISVPKQIAQLYASQNFSFTKSGNELLVACGEVVYMLKIASDDSCSIIHLFDPQSDSLAINRICSSSHFLAVSDFSDSVTLFDLNSLSVYILLN